MTSARQDLHSTARQLSMALDPTKLQGMTLPDDHRLPRPAVAGREICWFTRQQKWPRRIRKDMPPPTLRQFFPESPLWPTNSFMSQRK